MLERIIELFAEAETLAETERSKRVFNNLRKERGGQLSVYDIGAYFDALTAEIRPTETLGGAFDPSDLIRKLQEKTTAVITPDMTIGEVAALLS